MTCRNKYCVERALIQEKLWPHNAFCNKDCQTAYWLGVTPRLSEEEGDGAGEACSLKLGIVPLEANLSVRVLLNSPGRSLREKLRKINKILSLPEGTLRWPELRLAYRFHEPKYDFLHWLDFEFPVESSEGRSDIRLRWQTGDGTAVLVSHKLLVQAAQQIAQTDDETSDPSYGLTFLTLAKACAKGKWTDRMKHTAEGWHYTMPEQVTFHLMYWRSQNEAEQLAQVIAALMIQTSHTLTISSQQDYVAHALHPLGHLGSSRDTALLPVVRQLVFALPSLQDTEWFEALWVYCKAHDAPNCDYVEEARKVTVTVHEAGDHRKLVGYVTCSLRPASRPTLLEHKAREAWPTGVMRKFVDAGNSNVFDHFIIEGLSVAKEWRGGGADSIAVLLVFHALYFAQRCQADCGLARVSCQSEARSTALIMRQFGAVHCNVYSALRWMEARLKEGQSCALDLANFAEDYEGSAAVIRQYENEADQVAALRTQVTPPFTPVGDQWFTQANLAQNVYHSSDTFLVLDAANQKLHFQMARLERLLTERAEKKARRLQDSESDEERDRKVTKLGTPLTTLPFTALVELARDFSSSFF